MKLFLADGCGTYRPALDDEVVECAQSIIRARFSRGATISSPVDAIEFFRSELGSLDHEVFGILFLDNRHRIIRFQKMFRGSTTGSAVHPGECVKEALKLSAAAAVLTHNHPSGRAEPSGPDELITKRLVKAFDLVDVRVIDHIIVTATDDYSFAQNNRLWSSLEE